MCACGCCNEKRSAATRPAGSGSADRYRVVGTVIDDNGAVGTSAVPSADAAPRASAIRSAMVTTEMLIASVGQPCTQAGASPSASRSLHMSPLRTMPRSWSYTGTSYGHISVQ